MAIESNTLYEEANCYICAGVSQTQALILALERRWLLALDPDADVSVDGLLLEARCYRCNSNASISDLLELGMLSKIEALL